MKLFNLFKRHLPREVALSSGVPSEVVTDVEVTNGKLWVTLQTLGEPQQKTPDSGAKSYTTIQVSPALLVDLLRGTPVFATVTAPQDATIVWAGTSAEGDVVFSVMTGGAK